MKKVAIIGAGWVGCHLALKYKNKFNVTLFEKNEELFNETSFYNQNRLHLGFHYPRSYNTRKLCSDTYQHFINEYSHIIGEVQKNIYAVPEKSSILDYETIKQIYNIKSSEEIILPELKNISGAFLTKEKFINYKLAKQYFNQELKDLVKIKEIKDINKLSKEYDYVLNCTNNHLVVEKSEEDFYELTITLLCEKARPTNFDAITLVDGPFFSIYPYGDNLYTFTDVQETPVRKFKNIEELKKHTKFLKNETDFIQEKINSFFYNAELFYPEITKDFTYKDYYLSTKSKFLSSSDDRSPVIKLHDNIVSIYTGKIQGIFKIEEFIKNYIC